MNRVHMLEMVHSVQSGRMSTLAFQQQATLALGSATAANAVLAAAKSGPPAPRPVVITPAVAAQSEGTGAANPVATGNLITGMVDYPSGGNTTLKSYLARPKASGKHPAVVVIQEWWGLNENIKDIANRFAQAGYVALAPDLYHGVVVSEPNEARKLVMELDMAAAVSEIQQGMAYLLAQAFVTGPTAGVVGFCMGGRLTWMTALAADNMGAGVAFYGSPLKPEEAPQVKAPIMGLYGSEDGGIPVEGVMAIGDALTAAQIDNLMHVYDGAQHSFFNDTRPSYHPAAAADAWMRTLGWFGKHLR